MKKIVKALLLVTIVVTMVSCGDEEFDIFNLFDTVNYEIHTTKDRDNVSKSTFDNSIVGYGWKEIETHEINPDGSYTRENYWAYRDGGGPKTYEFLPGEAITYFFNDANPSGGSFKREACSYNDNGNIISLDGYPMIRIIHFSDTRIKAVVWNGITFDRDANSYRNVFLYVTMQRLSAEDLEKVRTAHNYHD